MTQIEELATQIEGFAVNENAMWYLVQSAKEQILKVAEELGQKRMRASQLQKQIASAKGIQVLLLENELKHLRAEAKVLYDQVDRFETGYNS